MSKRNLSDLDLAVFQRPQQMNPITGRMEDYQEPKRVRESTGVADIFLGGARAAAALAGAAVLAETISSTRSFDKMLNQQQKARQFEAKTSAYEKEALQLEQRALREGKEDWAKRHNQIVADKKHNEWMKMQVEKEELFAKAKKGSSKKT